MTLLLLLVSLCWKDPPVDQIKGFFDELDLITDFVVDIDLNASTLSQSTVDQDETSHQLLLCEMAARLVQSVLYCFNPHLVIVACKLHDQFVADESYTSQFL